MKRLLTPALFAALALTICPVAAATGDARYAQPGLLVAVDSTTLNFNCVGHGSPTVVFDAGWEDWSPAWSIVQPVIAEHTRTCSYDRAGAGFSSAGTMPRTSVEIARELHDALHAAKIQGPYLLVGHSFGSYNTRTFADLYMPEVYGLVLVDGEDIDVESAADRKKDDRLFAGALTELRQCRAALLDGHPFPPLPGVPRGTAPVPCNQQFFRGLPERMFSSELNDALLQITRTKAALYDEVISEAEEMPYDEQYLIEHRRSFGNRPIRVLTAQNHFYDNAKTPSAVHRRHLAFERTEAQNQAQWLRLSTDSQQIFAYKSGHYIELDQPEIVIDAILGELHQRHSPS
jgi:pimeloyl-ACP methyl ester carboxylesterase